MKSEIKEFLGGLKVPYKWVEHEAVFTVSESSKVLEGKEPIKNLLLRDKSKNFFLVIVSGNTKIDLKELSAIIGSKRLSFASPADLQRLLGVEPGSVSLFSLINDKNNEVKSFIDEKLLTAKELGFHPNDNTVTIFFEPKYLGVIMEKLGREMARIKI